MKKQTFNTLLAGAVALTALGTVSTAHGMLSDTEEKCYGVAKAGMNSCGSADGAHSCGGMAKEDASGIEWVAVPKGLCEKLVNGSLTPIVPEAASTEEPKADAK